MVAAGRLVNVKDADAHLTVISPRSGLSGEMKHRIYTEKVVDVYHDRSFGGEEDLYDAEGKLYDMVLTAIDDSDLSRSICVMARKLRIPVNVADVPPECDFYFGSLIRRGPLQVMVSTGGKGPKIANQVRMLVERSLPENVGEAISRVGVLRGKLRERVPEQKESGRRMRWMIDVCERWSCECARRERWGRGSYEDADTLLRSSMLVCRGSTSRNDRPRHGTHLGRLGEGQGTQLRRGQGRHESVRPYMAFTGQAFLCYMSSCGVHLTLVGGTFGLRSGGGGQSGSGSGEGARSAEIAARDCIRVNVQHSMWTRPDGARRRRWPLALGRGRPSV